VTGVQTCALPICVIYFELAINSYPKKVCFSEDELHGLDAACKLLLESCLMNDKMTVLLKKYPHGNKSDKDRKCVKHIEVTLSQFAVAQCQVCTLLKLSILSIRQHMPSKRKEDFEKLHLPHRLTSLVKFEALSVTLQEILCKQR
jgi:hypothetical protein